MAYPPIPAEIAQELDSLRIAASAAFQRQDWDSASRRFGETYAFLINQQEGYKQRFHKGWELHNWGITLFRLADFHTGIEIALLAYVEDVLSADAGQEQATHDAPARMIFTGMAGSEELLDSIVAAGARRNASQEIPLEPQEVLAEALSQSRVTIDELLGEIEAETAPRKRTVEGLEAGFEQRCFVGGNYYTGGSNLADICQAVKNEGYDPIVAREFDMRDEDIHHHSLLLLHLCSRAVFEVSNPAGQLMELERCRDYGITPLILRQTVPDADPQTSAVSAMIASMTGVEVQLYATIEDAREKIAGYLA